MHVVKASSLKITQFWRLSSTWQRDHPLGEVKIIHKEQRKEIEAWRVERKGREKPRFPVSIYEDCIKSWLVVKAKALYNSYVFPPFMIIQIVGFLAEAFPKVFSCVLCIDSSSSGYMCSSRSCSIFKLPQIDSRSRLQYFALFILHYRVNLQSDFLHGLRARFVENLQNFYMVSKLIEKFLHDIRAKFIGVVNSIWRREFEV